MGYFSQNIMGNWNFYRETRNLVTLEDINIDTYSYIGLSTFILQKKECEVHLGRILLMGSIL